MGVRRTQKCQGFIGETPLEKGRQRQDWAEETSSHRGDLNSSQQREPLGSTMWAEMARLGCYQLAQPLAGASNQSNAVWTVRLSAAQKLRLIGEGIRVASCLPRWRGVWGGGWQKLLLSSPRLCTWNRIHLCKLQPEGQIFCLALNWLPPPPLPWSLPALSSCSKPRIRSCSSIYQVFSLLLLALAKKAICSNALSLPLTYAILISLTFLSRNKFAALCCGLASYPRCNANAGDRRKSLGPLGGDGESRL